MGLGALQPGHLIVILVIVLLIFGPGKLPELGKAMGEGLRELKKATGGEHPEEAATHAASTTRRDRRRPQPGRQRRCGHRRRTVTPITAAPGDAAMLACPSCRGSVPVGDKFCGNCGATIEHATTASA